MQDEDGFIERRRDHSDAVRSFGFCPITKRRCDHARRCSFENARDCCVRGEDCMRCPSVVLRSEDASCEGFVCFRMPDMRPVVIRGSQMKGTRAYDLKVRETEAIVQRMTEIFRRKRRMREMRADAARRLLDPENQKINGGE